MATNGDPIVAEHRSIKIKGRNRLFGLLVSAFGGICFGFFSPAFNLATNDQFRLLQPGVAPLTVWTGKSVLA